MTFRLAVMIVFMTLLSTTVFTLDQFLQTKFKHCNRLADRFDPAGKDEPLNPLQERYRDRASFHTQFQSMRHFCVHCFVASTFHNPKCNLTKCDSVQGRFDVVKGECDCVTGWTGQLCHKQERLHCVHGILNEDDHCECDNGYYGDNCQIAYCESHGIWNRGLCQCEPLFNGSRCEQIQCVHGSPYGQHVCKCAFGFEGLHCETSAVRLPNSFWEIAGGLVAVGVLWTAVSLMALTCEYTFTKRRQNYLKTVLFARNEKHRHDNDNGVLV